MFFTRNAARVFHRFYSARRQGIRPIRESPVPEQGMKLSTSSSGRARLCDRYLPPIARARGFWAPRVRAFDFQDLTTKCITF
jgi:hypothetical protein